MNRPLPTIGFVGSGAAATALAIALASVGLEIVAVWSRRTAHSQRLAGLLPAATAYDQAQAVVDRSMLVFLAVPDAAIEAVCSSLRWRSTVSAVHCSGALSLDVLHAAAAAGASIGSFHPLQAFSGSPADADLLPGSVIGIEASNGLEDTLLQLARRLQARPLILRGGDKALYHAAAVFASNYVVTLMSMAAGLLGRLGFPREEAVSILLPLMRGAVANIERHGPVDALSGPIARGDTETVERHLDALFNSKPELLDAYLALAEQTLPIACEKRVSAGEDPERLRAVRSIVEGFRLQRAGSGPTEKE